MRKNLYAAAPVIREFPGVLIPERSFVLPPPEEEKRPQKKSDSEGQKDHIPQHFFDPFSGLMDDPAKMAASVSWGIPGRAMSKSPTGQFFMGAISVPNIMPRIFKRFRMLAWPEGGYLNN